MKQGEERATLDQKPSTPRGGGSSGGRSISTLRHSPLVSRVGWGVLLSLSLLLLIQQVAVVSQSPTDFCQDYLASQRFLQGRSPYLPLSTCQPLPGKYDSHSPFAVLLFLPFALLPASWATWLWGMFSLAAYLATGWLLLRELGWLSLGKFSCFVFGSALWLPFIFSEAVQNSAQLLTLLLTAAWILERRGRHAWAGILLGLAGLLKFWPALLLWHAIFRRRWKVVLYVGTTLMPGFLLTLLALGPQAYAVYLGTVQESERIFVPLIGNLALYAVVTRPLVGDPQVLPPLTHSFSLSQALWVGHAFSGMLLLGTGVFLWRSARSGQQPATDLLSYGLLVTVLLLSFPVLWYWGLVTLLLPCATLLLALRSVPKPPRWWLALLFVSLSQPLDVGWLIIRLPGWLEQGPLPHPPGWATLLFGLPTYGVLLFAGLQAYLLWKVSASHALVRQAPTPTSALPPGLTPLPQSLLGGKTKGG